MRFGLLTGLYVAVVCSAQIGANKIARLPVVHLQAPGGVYSIGSISLSSSSPIVEVVREIADQTEIAAASVQ